MHSRTVGAAAAGLVAALTGLAGCGAAPATPARTSARASVPASVATAPSELAVACTPAGVRVGGTAVATTASGVVLRVTSTASPGTTLDLGYADGRGEGFTVPASGVLAVAAPPGPLTLTCHEDHATAVRVTVVDPGAHWRATTLADAGCPLAPGQPSWAGGTEGRGPSARDAVLVSAAALQRVSGDSPGPVSASQAPVGYPDAPGQTWIVSFGGRAALTEMVERSGAGWLALPDHLCAS